MKFLLPIAAVLGLATADFADMEACIQEKCPDQYQACIAKTGCRDTLEKCANKCGTGVNIFCWGGCAGYTGPAVNAATCAVN